MTAQSLILCVLGAIVATGFFLAPLAIVTVVAVHRIATRKRGES